jgi:hypothetical protein
LDAQLAGASGVDDADLPALPEEFLIHLMSDGEATGTNTTRTGATAVVSAVEEPASVIAARQLVRDAQGARTARQRRRRPTRKTALRVGAALVAVAAALTTATLVTPSGHNGTPTAHPTAPSSGGVAANGIRLVAAQQDAFPVSFDPPPAGITPDFSEHTGDGGADPTVYTADYQTGTGDGFTLWLYPTDPRTSAVLQHSYFDWPQNDPNRALVTDSGTVSVHGAPAVYSHGHLAGVCETSCKAYAALLWQLPDGRWGYLLGEGSYGQMAVAQGVANSVVDHPQPTGLQLALAPAGWTLHGYEESRSLDLISDNDPKQRLHLSTIDRSGGATLDSVFQDLSTVGATESVTVNGQPGRLASGHDTGGGPDFWYVGGQFPNGPVFLLLAPKTLTRQQVLDIANAATYTP